MRVHLSLAVAALISGLPCSRVRAANAVSPVARVPVSVGVRSLRGPLSAPLPASPLKVMSVGRSLAPVPLLAPSVKPLIAPAVLPALPAALVLPLPVLNVSIEAPAAKLSAVTNEVTGLLDSAGPIDNLTPESGKGLGDAVFRALTGGPGAAGAGAVEPTATQQKMIQTLYQIVAVFSEQYAPIDWKKENFSVDLSREYQKAKAVILADPQITSRKFQDLINDFTAALRDYHVSVSFNSTERASLPFLVMEAEGKYFLAHIDRKKLPAEAFPFSVGDEVVAFDGAPTGETVRRIALEMGPNTAETDLRLAEIFLTNRRRRRGDDVPQGNVTLAILRQDGRLLGVEMAWDYVPELVPLDVPLRDSGLSPVEPPALASSQVGIDADFDPAPIERPRGIVGGLQRLFTNLAHSLSSLFAAMRAEDADNPFTLGARKSFIPKLGEVLWRSKPDAAFHAYIFKTKEGRKVGFIRIADYDGGAEEVAAFGKIMARFQKETDALVIDQVNNPGGAVFYLYALASHLTDKPLAAPRHRLVIDEGEAQWAGDLLIQLAQAQGKQRKKTTKKEDEDSWSGYPVTKKFVMLMVRFAQFILTQLESGKRFTDPTHLWGVDDIDPAPHPEQRYTKPIVLLTNALDFSGGDFFPAILQDNKRALVFGVRTAGAGGAVKTFSLPNQFGVGDFSATWTMARRADGRPIENLGVTPDVSYEITAKDLRTDFTDYRQALLTTLESLLSASGR